MKKIFEMYFWLSLSHLFTWKGRIYYDQVCSSFWSCIQGCVQIQGSGPSKDPAYPIQVSQVLGRQQGPEKVAGNFWMVWPSALFSPLPTVPPCRPTYSQNIKKFKYAINFKVFKGVFMYNLLKMYLYWVEEKSRLLAPLAAEWLHCELKSKLYKVKAYQLFTYILKRWQPVNLKLHVKGHLFVVQKWVEYSIPENRTHPNSVLDCY